MRKVIQITATNVEENIHLHALTNNGEIFVWSFCRQEWVEFPPIPQDKITLGHGTCCPDNDVEIIAMLNPAQRTN